MKRQPSVTNPLKYEPRQPNIEILPPDLTKFREGNTGIPYVTTMDSGKPGPHVLVNALTHGNELCGAIALCQLMERGLRPVKGRITFSFSNVMAFERFDPGNPYAARFVDEDFNRLWNDNLSIRVGHSSELLRAKALLPLVAEVDHLLDLHSMHLPANPLLITGMQQKSLELAQAIGYPHYVVRDAGHQAGKRMRDFAEFDDPASHKTAMLVECGQHWSATSVSVALATTLYFFYHFKLISNKDLKQFLPPGEYPEPQKIVEVTDPVTVETTNFHFVAPFQGFEVIPEKGTVIAYDGEKPVVTPYDDCVLVMPTPGARGAIGATAVRLGRYTV